MAKVDTDVLKKILEKNVTAVRERNQVLQDLKHVLENEALEKEMKPPTEKKEFVLIVSDRKGVLSEAYPEGVVGWIVQIPEGENPGLALDKLIQSAYDHNASPKGRKFPVETIGEACESLSSKTTKEHKVWVKTKIPVLAIPASNILPRAPGAPD